MELRRFEEKDAAALNAIYHDTIHNVNKHDYTPEELEAWAATAPYTEESRIKDIKRWNKINPFVAAIGDVPVGFAELEDEGHINCFYVHHAYQGKGAGTILLSACEQEAKRLGFSRLYAEVSITAKPFFLKNGFTVIRPNLSETRGMFLKNYVMEKML